MATIYGTLGADTLTGTIAGDLIQAGPARSPSSDTGNDTVSAGDGNDTV